MRILFAHYFVYLIKGDSINKYTDIFDYEDVPEKERKEVAQSVANWVIDSLNNPLAGMEESCESTCDQKARCCG